MISDVQKKYCPVCKKNTIHEQGCFKSREIGNELFHLEVSLDTSLKNLSDGFKDFVRQEQQGVMDSDSPGHYARNVAGGLNLTELFASVIRSLKCEECGHLIRISRLP